MFMYKNCTRLLNKSYVGYTNNFNKRLDNHNTNKGAKSTKGYKWELVYKKSFIQKTKHFHLNISLKKIEKKELNC